MPQVKAGLYYTDGHEWLRIRGANVFLGITDYAQKKLGGIVFADGEPEGSALRAGDVAGVIESVRNAADLVTPVSGVIARINERLAEEPEAINKKPYDCWLVKLALTDPQELDGLMSAADYAAYCVGL